MNDETLKALLKEFQEEETKYTNLINEKLKTNKIPFEVNLEYAIIVATYHYKELISKLEADII